MRRKKSSVKVTLRFRSLEKEKESLYLDFYPAITFEKMPQALEHLIQKVESLEMTLQSLRQQPAEPSNQWFDVDGLQAYLPDKPAKPTIYTWVSSGLIPYHKNGKRLRFYKSDIDNWLLCGKRKSEFELQIEAAEYINRKGGKK